MVQILQVIALVLAAIALTASLAHALELPGKLRLDHEKYLAVQTIYYPGFTLAGVAEPASIIIALVLLAMTDAAAPFWLIFAAALALMAMHAVFWVVTQPVNKYWLAKENLTGVSLRFFGKPDAGPADWRSMRRRWEYSHVVRAALSGAAFVLLAVAFTF